MQKERLRILVAFFICERDDERFRLTSEGSAAVGVGGETVGGVGGVSISEIRDFEPCHNRRSSFSFLRLKMVSSSRTKLAIASLAIT